MPEANRPWRFLAALSVGTVSLLWWGRPSGAEVGTSADHGRVVPDDLWEELVGHPLKGKDADRIGVVLFCEPTCGHCAGAVESVAALQRDMPSAVEVVLRQYTGGVSPVADGLARGVLCAQEQGRALLFLRQVRGTPVFRGTGDEVAAVAAGAGIHSLDKFRTCLDLGTTRQTLRRDADLANRLGIRVTPTLVINGRVFVGAISADSVRSLVAVVGRQPQSRQGWISRGRP